MCIYVSVYWCLFLWLCVYLGACVVCACVCLCGTTSVYIAIESCAVHALPLMLYPQSELQGTSNEFMFPDCKLMQAVCHHMRCRHWLMAESLHFRPHRMTRQMENIIHCQPRNTIRHGRPIARGLCVISSVVSTTK